MAIIYLQEIYSRGDKTKELFVCDFDLVVDHKDSLIKTKTLSSMADEIKRRGKEYLSKQDELFFCRLSYETIKNFRITPCYGSMGLETIIEKPISEEQLKELAFMLAR